MKQMSRRSCVRWTMSGCIGDGERESDRLPPERTESALSRVVDLAPVMIFRWSGIDVDILCRNIDIGIEEEGGVGDEILAWAVTGRGG